MTATGFTGRLEVTIARPALREKATRTQRRECSIFYPLFTKL
jgi:hypothetical protein